MQLTTLPSGLRIVTEPLPGTEAATVLILAGAGSRYEARTQNGIAHFLEHMFFKGGAKYKTPKDVSETIDAIGGDFNAFTGKEYAGYYVKVAARHIEIAYDVLADMLVSATFPTHEIEKERGVILEEYNMYQDTPMYQIGWDFERLLYGDQPMGWDQLGTPETIRSFQRDDFVNFKASLYQPDNIVIAVAGKCDHAEVVAHVTQLFQFQNGKKASAWTPLADNTPASPVIIQNKKTEQGHLTLGVRGVAAEDPRHYVQRLLAIILGGNMSSRLFLEVREKKGLCYSVRTSTDDYTDSGVVSTYAGVTISKLADAVGAIREEYDKLARDGVTADELVRAKEYLKGKLTLRLEDSEEYAHLLAKQYLLYREKLTPTDIFARIDATTTTDIQSLAKEIFVSKNLRLAVIGPFGGREAELAKLIA